MSSIAFTFCQTSKDKNVNFRINNIKFLEVLENNLKSLRKLKIKEKNLNKNCLFWTFERIKKVVSENRENVKYRPTLP